MRLRAEGSRRQVLGVTLRHTDIFRVGAGHMAPRRRKKIALTHMRQRNFLIEIGNLGKPENPVNLENLGNLYKLENPRGSRSSG